jgi:hypothetical protein
VRATWKTGEFTRDSSLLPKLICWLKLAEQARDTGGALSHESDPAALFPLPEKPAAYPVEYGKRAGELIARGARSLSPRSRK